MSISSVPAVSSQALGRIFDFDPEFVIVLAGVLNSKTNKTTMSSVELV